MPESPKSKASLFIINFFSLISPKFCFHFHIFLNSVPKGSCFLSSFPDFSLRFHLKFSYFYTPAAMSEPPLKPVLKKPPGYKNTNSLVGQPGFRPRPREPLLPPSYHPKKRKISCCRVCCCCFCVFLILFLLIIICGAFFYLWFDPKLPGFHIQSFRISHFKITNKPDGTSLDAATTTRLEVKNPNGKMTYYFGDTEVDVSIGKGGDETGLGTTTVPEFTLGELNTTSLKVETKASNKLVVDEVAGRLLRRYRRRTLPVNMEARTKVGLGVAGLKIGVVGVTVKCDGITMKQLDGGDMPKCIINVLKWLNIH